MENLKLRLSILKESKQITEIEELKLLEIAKMLNLNSENGAMLITHLAMVLNRIRNEVGVEKLDDEQIDEILNNQRYDEAQKILSEIKNKLNVEMSNNEDEYILMHILALLEGGIK